jgi:hypothetical protein
VTGLEARRRFPTTAGQRRIVHETKPAASLDAVNPAHYRGDAVMRIIEEWDLGFCLGNVIKYILRHDMKAGIEDLKKARWYLDREISRREAVAK